MKPDLSNWLTRIAQDEAPLNTEPLFVRSPARNTAAHAQKPLRVVVAHEADQSSYALDADSVARVREALGPGWKAPTIRISDADEADLAFYRGQVVPNLVPIVTGFDQERLRTLGGVRFVEGATGQVIFEWPPQAA